MFKKIYVAMMLMAGLNFGAATVNAEEAVHCDKLAVKLASKLSSLTTHTDEDLEVYKLTTTKGFHHHVVIRTFNPDGEPTGCQAYDIETEYLFRSLVCDFVTIKNRGNSGWAACDSL